MIDDIAPQQTAEQARQQAQEIREQIRAAREAAQDAAREAREAAREAQRDAEEAAREAAANVREQDGPVIVRVPRPQIRRQDTEIGIPPWQRQPDIPREAVEMVGIVSFALAAVLILRPIMRAFGARLERRGAAMAVPPEVTAHMQRLETAVEAIAIEVERISEGQRYTTKLLAERAKAPSSLQQPS